MTLLRPPLARVLAAAAMAAAFGCSSALTDRPGDRPAPAGPPPLVVPAASGLTSAQRPEASPTEAGAAALLELELAEAVVMAVANNPALEVAAFGPPLADTVVREERSRFDPGLAASLLWEDAGRQLSAVQRFTFRPEDGGDGDGGQPQRPLLLARENLTLTTTLSTLLPTGTQLSLFGTVDRSETNFTPREYEGSWTFQVIQPLLEGTGDRVNLVAVRQAENRAVQSRWELHTTVLDVVAEVERAYWDLVLARKVVDIREFGVRLAAEQLELNRDLVETGRAVRSAALSALAEERSRQADLAEARGRVRALSVGLLRLLRPAGTAPDAEVRPLTEPSVLRLDPDSEAAVHVALLRRPELALGRIEELNSGLEVSAARDGAQPGLDLVAAYGRTSLGLELGGAFDHLVDDTPYDTVTLGLELELPLVRRGDRARLERAKLAERRSRARVEDLELRVAEEVRRAVIAVQSRWERVQAAREAVTAREEELRIERDRYEVGMARNLDVLAIQRLLIEARVQAVEAEVEYLQAQVDLHRAQGTLLEHRGIILADAVPLPAP